MSKKIDMSEHLNFVETSTPDVVAKYIDQLQQQLAEKDKEIERQIEVNKRMDAMLGEQNQEIERLKEDKNWYSMWHNKFKNEIERLQTELETYRPTHLRGNGYCHCSSCNNEVWTDWCVKYDGKTYCDNCFKQVETRDDKIRHQICEKIREFCKELGTTDDIGVVTITVDEELHTDDNLLDFLEKIEKGE